VPSPAHANVRKKPIESISFAQRVAGLLPQLVFAGRLPAAPSPCSTPAAGVLLVFQNRACCASGAELYQASLVTGRSVCFPLEDLLAQARSKFDNACNSSA